MPDNHQEFKYIKVTIEVEYVLPMYSDTASKINGWTPDDWFRHTDINRSHATRDSHILGGSKNIIAIKVVSDPE